VQPRSTTEYPCKPFDPPPDLQLIECSTSSANETLEHILSVLTPVIKSLNFSVSAFDDSPKSSPFHITLSKSGKGFEPAPITSGDSESFELMAGTCKHVFGEDTIVTPTGMYGQFPFFPNLHLGPGMADDVVLANTDTKWMWNLTQNIYRFTPAVLEQTMNVHTVNEVRTAQWAVEYGSLGGT